ncbi:MAG: ribonuclease HII [Candidatus Omnitrophica bacterium]|nr:ribonuclease HII [Candidatus Omnitrophota bacterium]
MIKKGRLLIAGIDEVGRGALAGPVVAAAVLFGSQIILNKKAIFKGEVKDSKLLSSKKREQLFRKISQCSFFSTASVSNKGIDKINILKATLEAMRKAVLSLPLKPDILLIDGNMTIDLNLPQIAIPGGDRRCFSISAASIMAKVTRDRLMDRMDKKYPGYNFINNKGYGTEGHICSIFTRGPSPIHRMSFAPLKNGRFFG